MLHEEGRETSTSPRPDSQWTAALCIFFKHISWSQKFEGNENEVRISHLESADPTAKLQPCRTEVNGNKNSSVSSKILMHSHSHASEHRATEIWIFIVDRTDLEMFLAIWFFFFFFCLITHLQRIFKRGSCCDPRRFDHNLRNTDASPPKAKKENLSPTPS